MSDDDCVACFMCGRLINLKRTSYQERFFSGERRVCHLYNCAAAPFVGQEARTDSKEGDTDNDL